MKPSPDPHYRHRFPAEIISHAVWLYHVFSLSLRDVELLPAERGIVVSYAEIAYGAGARNSARALPTAAHRRPWPRQKLFSTQDEILIRIYWRAALSLARHVQSEMMSRSTKFLASSRPSAMPTRCEALIHQHFERFAVCAAGHRDRQAEKLWCGAAPPAARRRAPTEPLSQQSRRELTPTDATPRAADATV